MATGWTDITSGSGGAGEIQGDVDDVGADGFFEPVRASLIAAAHAEFDLGGSRTQGVVAITPTYEAIIDYRDWDVPAAKEAGFAYVCHIEGITESASTSITVRLRNITDSTTLHTFTAITGTTWTKASQAITPVAGKVYRLEAIRSNDSYFTWCLGKIIRRNT